MRRHRIKRVLGLAVAITSAAVSGQESARPGAGDIQLTPETGPRVTFKKCYRDIAGVAERPSHVHRAPAGALKWYVFPWGDGEAVIARQGRKLWADCDGDGDLREETPIEAGRGVQTPMTLALPSGPIQTRLEIDVVGEGLRLTNLTRMSGTVRIGDQDVPVSLSDYLCNGRYDDYRTTETAEYWLCDHIHFDLDGDGKFKNRIPPTGEDFCLARGFVFGNAVYRLEVQRHGEALRFGPMARKLAKVRVNVAAFNIALVSDEFGACRLNGKAGTAMLPEGRYRLDYCSYQRGSYTYRGLWWKEDGVPWVDLVDGMQFELAGKLRYELYHEPNGKGGVNLWSICYGPHNERVMLWSDRRTSIEPTIAVESVDGDPLWSIVSHYC